VGEIVARRNAVDTSKVNFTSLTWISLRDIFQGKIDELRIQNDAIHCPWDRTVEIRAKIAVYKGLIELETKK